MSVPAAFTVVTLMWATTPLAIQWGATELGGATALLLRIIIALCVGLSIIWLRGIQFPWNKRTTLSYFAGGSGFSVGMLTVYIAAETMPSGMISVLFGVAPLLTGLLAAWWLRSRELTPIKCVGLLIALAGLAYVFRAELSRGGARAQAVLLMCISVFSFCASGIWVKELKADVHPLTQTMGALVVSLILLVPAWLLSGEGLPVGASARAWAAVVYLAIGGSVLGFMAYFYLLTKTTATTVATTTLITPVLAVTLGTLLNNEPLTTTLLVGASIILAGLAIYVWGPVILNNKQSTLQQGVE